jgi:hypothetical protein
MTGTLPEDQDNSKTSWRAINAATHRIVVTNAGGMHTIFKAVFGYNARVGM